MWKNLYSPAGINELFAAGSKAKKYGDKNLLTVHKNDKEAECLEPQGCLIASVFRLNALYLFFGSITVYIVVLLTCRIYLLMLYYVNLLCIVI